MYPSRPTMAHSVLLKSWGSERRSRPENRPEHQAAAAAPWRQVHRQWPANRVSRQRLLLDGFATASAQTSLFPATPAQRREHLGGPGRSWDGHTLSLPNCRLHKRWWASSAPWPRGPRGNPSKSILTLRSFVVLGRIRTNVFTDNSAKHVCSWIKHGVGLIPRRIQLSLEGESVIESKHKIKVLSTVDGPW